MIDSEALFKELPQAVQSGLGATEQTYEQLEGYIADAMALCSHINADIAGIEALAKLYAKGMAARQVGFEVGEDYMEQFSEIKKSLEDKYAKYEQPIYISTDENVEFDDEELAKW